MERKVYVKALAQISLQQEDPDYGKMFSVMEARRLSRLMKRALAVSRQVLSQAGVAVPDAVITGTGLGCIENTERFLQSLTGLSDAPLRPTHFMQSTHNTIGSLIAISLGCHGYNATYSHLGISFESGLLDAMVLLRLGIIRNVLVGAFEEMTPGFALLLEKGGYRGIRTPDGRLSETAVSLFLDTEPEGALCEMSDVRLGQVPASYGGTALRTVRADWVARYGENFSVSALGTCDAVRLIASGAAKAVVLDNDFYGKSRSTLLLSSVCGK